MSNRTTKIKLFFSSLVLLPVLAHAGSFLPASVSPERQTPTLPPPDGGITPPSAPVERERPEKPVDESARKIKFNFKKLEFEGNTIYSYEDLYPIFEDMLDKEVSLADLQLLTEAIEKRYVENGYILTRVIIPPQEIDASGVVKLQVVEGFVADVLIEGETNKVLGMVEALIKPVLQSKPLQIKIMERSMLLINDLPGVTTKAVLTPSVDVPGASTLVLVIEQDTFEGNFTWNNRGTKYVGPNQFITQLSLNNIFQHVARTTLDSKITSATRELRSFDLRHNAQVFENGSTLEGSLTYNRVQPGNDLSSLKVDGKSTTVALIYRYPFIRSRRVNLSGTLIYDYLNSETKLSNILFTLDRIESARAGISFDILDNLRGINLITATYAQGLNMFSGEEQPPLKRSRADGRKDYGKVQATYTRLQYLPDNFSLFFSTSGQYAFNALLSAEEFGYGGEQYGSAYDSSEIVGDSGVDGKIELRYNYPESSKLFPSTQYYASYDWGVIWDKHDDTGEGKQSGTSLAAGIRLELADRANGSLEIAKPLTRKVAAYDNKDVRWFFGITVDLAP